MLVVGELGWPLLADGRPSKSLALAKSYGVPIASERQFLEWLGQGVPDEQAKTYTADQIASLSGLPTEVIEQLDDVRPDRGRGGRYGFRDLAAARQVAGLFASGVALSAITRSLHEIRKWLPDARALQPASCFRNPPTPSWSSNEGPHRQDRPVRSRVDKPAEDADALFDEAQAAEEAERRRDGGAALSPGHAHRSRRTRPRLQPRQRAARRAGARSRRRRPIGPPPRPIPASPRPGTTWPTCSTTSAAPTRRSTASSARSMPIPDYADAMFNLGLFLQRLERHAEAAEWWRRYLAVDGKFAVGRARQARAEVLRNAARSGVERS